MKILNGQSKWTKGIVIGSGGLVLSLLAWAVTNNTVNVCSSAAGNLAQVLSTQSYNECSEYNIVHSIGIAGIVVSVIVVIVGTIGNWQSR
jgi:hypothetical protein